MELNINIKEKKNTIGDLKIGDIFTFPDINNNPSIMMKIDNTATPINKSSSINIRKGSLHIFSNDEKIIAYDKVIISLE